MSVFDEFLITIVLAVGASAAAYFSISFLLSRMAHRQLSADWKRFFSPRWADRAFLVLALGYMLVFTALAVIRYLTFHAGYLGLSTAWDLGQYGQLIWNSLNGRLLQGTFVRDTDSFLGKTFTPILLAFVPLYAVWSSPMVLLVVQTVGLGLGGFPLYWFARERLGHALALVIALAYYLSPGLENIGLAEFHEIALAPPLLAYATFFLLRRHYPGFLVCLGLALLVKEEIAFVAIMFGVYIFLVQRNRRLGFAAALFGAVWVGLLLQYLIPFFRGAEYGGTFYYFGEGEIGGGGTRYGYLGRNLPEVLATIITRPGFVLQHVLIPEKIEYVLHLLVPLAFVPLVGAEVFALTLPTFGYSLLSTYGLQYSIQSSYFAPLLPFLFFAAVVGLQRLLNWSKRWTINSIAWKGALAALLFIASGSNYFFQAQGPLGRYFQPWRYILDAHAALGNELVRLIPTDAVVVAQNELLAHISNRREVYEIPIPDYRHVDYLIADRTGTWYNVHRGFWEKVLATGYFEIVTQPDGYLIAKRKAPDHSLRIRFRDRITLIGYSSVATDTLRGGMTFRPILLWQAEQPLAERYNILVQIQDKQGHVWATEDREPQDGHAPTNQWETGKPVGDQYTLPLPPTLPLGDFQVTVAVHRAGSKGYLEAYDEQGNLLGTEAVVASVRIEKDKGSYLASQLWWIEQPLYVDMGEIRFLGYVPPRQTISPGELLQVGLYWRAREKPRGDYVVAVQLRGASGRVAFEQANRPADGTYPTTQWEAGEVLLDWHDFVLPSDFAAGDYDIVVVLRDVSVGRVLGEAKIATIAVIR